jgi:hypothetical protein
VSTTLGAANRLLCVAVRTPKTSLPKRKSVSPRTRTAFHEAGHAVLSLAIANAPEVVSIRVSERTAGRIVARPSARSTTRIQVHLAGYAAEHLLTGRRPRNSRRIGRRFSEPERSSARHRHSQH